MREDKACLCYSLWSSVVLFIFPCHKVVERVNGGHLKKYNVADDTIRSADNVSCNDYYTLLHFYYIFSFQETSDNSELHDAAFMSSPSQVDTIPPLPLPLQQPHQETLDSSYPQDSIPPLPPPLHYNGLCIDANT